MYPNETPVSDFIDYLNSLPPGAIEQKEPEAKRDDAGKFPWQEGYAGRNAWGACVAVHAAICFEFVWDGVAAYAEDGIVELCDRFNINEECALDVALAACGAPDEPFTDKAWETNPAVVFGRLRDKYGEVPGNHPDWSLVERSARNIIYKQGSWNAGYS